MLKTGCDHLLADLRQLTHRSYGLLAHGASVTSDLVPLHLALARSSAGPPSALYGPEHGYYGIEQDMVASAHERDPWTGVPVVSLYGDDEASLRPQAEAFDGLDVLLIDLQDVGARYYTYAATAVWAAEAALSLGIEVWVLDRPNPLGGTVVEGNMLRPGFDSFVGAFPLPVRHGLTLGELVRLEAHRRGWDPGQLRVWPASGWRRGMTWYDTGRPWFAPSPNMPRFETAVLYPGACLMEATSWSEGRGTTRPFHLLGAPGIDPLALAQAADPVLQPAGLTGIPTYFRPQFQKHAGRVCGGLELIPSGSSSPRTYATFVRLVSVLHRLFSAEFDWRSEAYEFVTDRPAIDLLTGDALYRQVIDRPDDVEAWIDSWTADEAAFRIERRDVLLYPEEP